MPSSLVSLGANLGNTLETMRSASRLIRDAFENSRIELSPIFKTPPVGGPSGQGDFLNSVVRIDHALSVWEVWERIKRIENELGRQRFRRWESRRIDIDLLMHDQDRVWTPHLKVPHPRMSMRTFVIHPACEIAPDWIDPVSGVSIRELSNRLRNNHPPRISIACSTKSLADRIATVLRHGDLVDQKCVQLFFCDEPSDWSKLSPHADLHMACVEIPDPESVQWEDYCLPWALAMGFVNSSSVKTSDDLHPSDTGLGARYLLPGIDVEWVCHEIQAALLALRCPVEPTGDSWVA
ncbi:MAG: 2-amino-4-hydroxy-6-hydroxymethyldihydropteridine diphosphokinase [Planctomycetota bacterium]|jgi:2-amino-4-hydroxy-6-hydroxymethyldihydropteridine diphosphokinase